MFSRPSRATLVPLIVSCALFMENLDSSIIATALPVISRSLGTDPLHLNLAITTYLLGLALFIPLSGWMADRFGARTVFRAAIVVFMLGSISCGMAQDLFQLVTARFLQGVGGAMMVPVGRLVLLKSVAKTELVGALAWLTIPALIGPTLGPPLGGFIVTYWSWRWIFFVNLPIGALGLVLVSLFIDNIREEKTAPLDVRGFIFLALGVACLVFGFETAGRAMIPNAAVVALAISGVAFLALYLHHARRIKHPIIDLSLFRVPTFFAGIVGGSIFRIGIGALPFLMPMLLQIGFGMSPLASGLLTFAGAAGAMVMKTLAQRIIRRYGFRRVLLINAVVSSAFLAIYALFRPETPHLVIFLLLLAGGFFRSLQFTGLNALSFSDMSNRKMSRATTISSMCQQLALSFGVASGACLLNLTLILRRTTELTAQDFWPAFVGIGVISALSVFFFIPMPHDAGSEVSGHTAKTPPVVSEV